MHECMHAYMCAFMHVRTFRSVIEGPQRGLCQDVCMYTCMYELCMYVCMHDRPSRHQKRSWHAVCLELHSALIRIRAPNI